MAGITRRLSHLRPKPYPIHRPFSSSPHPEPPSQPQPTATTHTTPNQRPLSSNLRATMQKESPPHQTPREPSPPPPPPSKSAALDEIRRNLQEYRLRSAPPPPSDQQPVLFQQIYKDAVAGGSAKPSPLGGKLSLDAIRESLRHLKPTQSDSVVGNPLSSIARFKEGLKADLDPTMTVGGSGDVFGKGDNAGAAMMTRTGLVKMYDHVELGKKLKMLRPQKRSGEWFSFRELNERLAKLRTIEERESEGKFGGVFKDIRDSVKKLATATKEKDDQRKMQRLDILGSLGGTPSFMLEPPKDHLVEKFFHPDNMSSAEKLKLELKKVRDEFKMSESDCGSARVQVAQLTTKIKHLSTVLQKKDKHSRKGLQAMVQRRKKLLKYLRRTDWDSFCLVLSKLGLRDNPDIKA